MARTRNLDPGRVSTLHYAFSERLRHAKPLVYACLLLLGLGTCSAALATAQVSPAGQTGPAAVPCAACQILSLEPAQSVALPAALNGLRILIRIAPGTPPDEWESRVKDVRTRGGRPGLHLTGIPTGDDPALAAPVDILLIEAEGADPDRLAFETKRALAAARGHGSTTTLLVAARTDLSAALRERGVAPYATEFITPPAPIPGADDLLTPTTRSLVVRQLPVESGAAILAAAAALQSWFPEGLVPIPDRALACGANRALPTFLNPRTLDLSAVSGSCPAPAVVTSDMAGAPVERHDLPSVSAFLVHAGPGERFAEGVDVAAARSLTVEEIIARHQAARARQSASIATDVATGTLALTFEAPGFVAPVTITSDMTMYEGTSRDVRQANIRVNGVPFNANGGVPRLPIIEPERAAAPPLTITLSELYRYRLVGRGRVRGRDAYEVAFAPRARGASLYEGRAWIDAGTFGIARVAATQTGLKGPVTASEQTDDFAPDAEGRWLLARSDVRQTYEGASVRTPIHRVLAIDRHEINRADFDAARAAAHASNDVMLRDTPEGYRYLARDRSRQAEARINEPARVVAGRAERIRTLAFGAIVDPNISTPLPFAGISYVDFNLFGTGTQFSGFFGGSYGQLAFSAPSLGGTRWQLAGRAFGIATSYNDRAFDRGREQYELDIRQRPAQAAVWLLRPLSARTALRFEYDWDYNRFGHGDVTAPDFVIPRNQNAHAVRVGVDAQRRGWQASVWGSYARRIGWRPWGIPGSDAYRPAHADFQRFGASVQRSAVVAPRLTTRVEAAVMGGRDLDRFSRYAFGTFDNRLHGYPSALIRYDRGGVVRTAAAWSLGAVRLDGFADTSAVHDPGFGAGLRRYSGVGAAIEAPGPFRTLLSLEWGYGFQGIDTNGRTGTQVVRFGGYKVF